MNVKLSFIMKGIFPKNKEEYLKQLQKLYPDGKETYYIYGYHKYNIVSDNKLCGIINPLLDSRLCDAKVSDFESSDYCIIYSTTANAIINEVHKWARYLRSDIQDRIWSNKLALRNELRIRNVPEIPARWNDTFENLRKLYVHRLSEKQKKLKLYLKVAERYTFVKEMTNAELNKYNDFHDTVNRTLEVRIIDDWKKMCSGLMSMITGTEIKPGDLRI